jgi:SAM-dependent methyltransferase
MSVPCPLCGAGTVHRLDVPDRFAPDLRYQIRRCRGCGVGFTHPWADSHDPAYEPHRVYAGAPRTRGTRAAILRVVYRGEGSLLERAALALPGLLFRARDRLKVLARELYAHPFRRRGRLLDIGSGGGNALALWTSQHDACIGLEPDATAAATARREFGLDVRAGVLEDGAFPDASFDAITLCHVLEHVDDPPALLRLAARLLKPGGEILMWMPDAESPLRRLLGAAWFPYEVPRHRWHFRRTDVARLLREAGLRTVEVAPDWRDGSLRTSARAWGGAAGALLKRRSARILVSLAQRLFRCGDSMRIRGVKPGGPG